MLAQLRESASRSHARGVRLVCIVQARAEELDELCGSPGHALGRQSLPLLECIADPEHRTHGEFGLSRMPWWRVFTRRELWRRQREAARLGFRQSWRRTFAPESDKLRNPAAALIGCGGKILWLYRGEHPADLPSPDNLLAVASKCGASVPS